MYQKVSECRQDKIFNCGRWLVQYKERSTVPMCEKTCFFSYSMDFSDAGKIANHGILYYVTSLLRNGLQNV